MGILNVTPDSFSDGGAYTSMDAAVAAGLRMIEDGADLIDVGGESTRPGASPVTEDEELRRVIPVVEGLAANGARVSIDTRKAAVAARALAAGAVVVNDVTALADPDMAAVCAASGCQVCLMHMRGTPADMMSFATYVDVVQEVRDHLLERAMFAEGLGIQRERIWIDPGIGFAKTAEHNLKLLNALESLVQTGYPVLIGVSRKSFIGRVLGQDDKVLPVEERLEGGLAAQIISQMKGAAIIRAHDITPARRAIEMVYAIQRA